MKLRHFGQNDEKQGERVKYKVVRIVLGEKARQEKKNDGNDGKKLLRRGELHALIKLFPLRQVSGFPLIHGHPWCSFRHMKKDEIPQIVNGIGECPCPSCTQPGIDKEQKMENNCNDDIGRPSPFGIEPGMIRVKTTGRFANNHREFVTKTWRSSTGGTTYVCSHGTSGRAREKTVVQRPFSNVRPKSFFFSKVISSDVFAWSQRRNSFLALNHATKSRFAHLHCDGNEIPLKIFF